ncbi:MAG: hypothetical protein FD156_1181 [Nitrospirae bacterium]|nr:MAG: hypothetical protein FD156_1181 [Nitrospirota bacterium]
MGINYVGQKLLYGDTKFKVTERAAGFVRGRWAKETGYWVQVTGGTYKGYKKGEELLMSRKEIENGK